jgi:hypothetical protein
MTGESQNRLAEVLAEQARSKAGLARALEVSRKTVVRWCAPGGLPPESRWDEISAWLKVDRADLFDETRAA